MKWYMCECSNQLETVWVLESQLEVTVRLVAHSGLQLSTLRPRSRRSAMWGLEDNIAWYCLEKWKLWLNIAVCLCLRLSPSVSLPLQTFDLLDADYADDIAILANTPDQAETLLHSLERAAASIGLHVNAHKTEYMCYNQTGDISTLEGTPLKLVDKFTYLGSSVESTEKDIETRLTKAWTAINRLSTIWKSDLTDKMKRSFFQAAVTSILLYGCSTWTLWRRN